MSQTTEPEEFEAVSAAIGSKGPDWRVEPRGTDFDANDPDFEMIPNAPNYVLHKVGRFARPEPGPMTTLFRA